jgi:hypothetical protein
MQAFSFWTNQRLAFVSILLAAIACAAHQFAGAVAPSVWLLAHPIAAEKKKKNQTSPLKIMRRKYKSNTTENWDEG